MRGDCRVLSRAKGCWRGAGRGGSCPSRRCNGIWARGGQRIRGRFVGWFARHDRRIGCARPARTRLVVSRSKCATGGSHAVTGRAPRLDQTVRFVNPGDRAGPVENPRSNGEVQLDDQGLCRGDGSAGLGLIAREISAWHVGGSVIPGQRLGAGISTTGPHR